MKKKVLVVFGNIAYYGQERSNIELFSVINDRVDPFFLVHHKWAHLNIIPELEKKSFKYKSMHFTSPVRKNFTLLTYLKSFILLFRSNFDFLKNYFSCRPDAVHFSNDWFFMSLLPSLLFVRKPIVFRLGDLPTQHYGLYKLLWKIFIVRKVSKFICISKYIQHELLKVGCSSSKANLVYSYPYPRSDTLEKLSLKNTKKFRVAYMGQLKENKGVGVLIDAFFKLREKYDDVDLVLAGAIHHTNDYSLKIVEFVQKSEYSNDITFLGYVENVADLLKKSNINVAPSIYPEGLGNIVLEAKKYSLPSIVFDSGALSEMIEHKVNGYVCESKNSEELFKAMEYFYLMKDWGKAFGEKARISLDEGGFNKITYRQKVLDVYDF